MHVWTPRPYSEKQKKDNAMHIKSLSAATFAAAMLASGAALADRPGADWISIEQAIETAKKAGYTQLHSVEADDGHWEGKGLKQDGKVYEFKIDGKTGQVTLDQED